MQKSLSNTLPSVLGLLNTSKNTKKILGTQFNEFTKIFEKTYETESFSESNEQIDITTGSNNYDKIIT